METLAPETRRRMPATRARQGAKNPHLMIVLLVSLVAAAAAMFIALAVSGLPNEGGGPMTRQETPSEAGVVGQPSPTPGEAPPSGASPERY